MSPALLQYHIHSMKSNAAKNAIRIKNNNKVSISSNSNSNSNMPPSSYFMDTIGLGIMWL